MSLLFKDKVLTLGYLSWDRKMWVMYHTGKQSVRGSFFAVKSGTGR
jgi:hypothetical protein